MSEKFSIIGRPMPMVDAARKTTGEGKYTDDLSVPGMLVGKILHSPYPHAASTMGMGRPMMENFSLIRSPPFPCARHRERP